MYKRKYNKNQQSFAEIVIISIAKGLWLLVSWPFKRFIGVRGKGVKIDKIANHRKWIEIEKLLESGDEIHAKQAIIEADKFFDSMMRLIGGTGEKFADRLRSLENHLNHDNYQNIWEAHKVRNQISHEMDYKISVGEARNVVEKFRRGLSNMGAL